MWNPSTLAVSFKLETDMNVLLHKASNAIENQLMDVVVANELHTRHSRVFIVESREKNTELKKEEGKDLETAIVACIDKLQVAKASVLA